MGTRRSKHDRGRKPRRKDNAAVVCKAAWDVPNFNKTEPTAAEILAKPAYCFDLLLNQNLHWSDSDKAALRILAEAKADPNKTSIALGREPKTIAYKARDLGIVIPDAWAAFIPKGIYVAKPRERRVLLSYPFCVQVDTQKDADLISVNKLVPRGIPDHMRGDVCQDILLAIYEGKVNLSTLQARPDVVKQFISRWRNANLERGGYGMMSIDPYGDDKRSWEEQAAAVADWDYSQMNDARGNWEAMSQVFTPATQIDEVFMKEVDREHLRLVDSGEPVSFGEALERVERGERQHIGGNLIADRIRIARHVADRGFALKDKLAVNPAFLGKKGARHSQYLSFKIPNSELPEIKVRIGNHEAHRLNTSQLDSYKLGVDGVLRVIDQLADNVEQYEAIHRQHNDLYDVMKEAGGVAA